MYRPLYNTTPFLEYDHATMQEARTHVKQFVDSIQLYQRQQAQAHLPRMPLTVGQKVIVVRGPTPNAVSPGQGPYSIVRLIGTTGAELKHTKSGETLTAPRKWLRPLLERNGDEKDEKDENSKNLLEPPTEKPTSEPTEESEEETETQESAKESSEKQSKPKLPKTTEPPKKKRRMLATLDAYNQPTEKKAEKIAAKVGHLAIVKQGNTARPAEILEDLGENWKLQWYGTTTNKQFPRRRWKWYPGWETEEGEVKYHRSQSAGKPAECVLPKSEVLLTFPKLTLHSAFPQEVVDQLHDLTL